MTIEKAHIRTLRAVAGTAGAIAAASEASVADQSQQIVYQHGRAFGPDSLCARTPRPVQSILPMALPIPAPGSRELLPVPDHALEPRGLWGRLRDAVTDFTTGLVGYLEMLGKRFPVHKYQADVYAFDKDGRPLQDERGMPIRTAIRRGSRRSNDEIRALAGDQPPFHAMVDLCAESGTEQDRLAKSLGMKVLHLHILDNHAPTIAQAKQAVEFLRANGPVYVHCEAGVGRTGSIIGAYRIAVEGWTAAQAIDEARRYGHGLKPCQKRFLIAFAAALRAEQIA